MLDFLFRFSVLNTSFTVIGKEIGEKLGSLGGKWFRCLYIWTLYFFISEWRNNTLSSQISTIGVVSFLLSNGYLMVVNRLRSVKYLNLLDIGFLRRYSTLLGKLTFPASLWRYVWGPANSGLKCACSSFIGENTSVCYVWVTKGLAFLLLCIVVQLCCQDQDAVGTGNNNAMKQVRTPPPVPQRPPSVRIQAMRDRHKKLQDSD